MLSVYVENEKAWPKSYFYPMVVGKVYNIIVILVVVQPFLFCRIKLISRHKPDHKNFKHLFSLQRNTLAFKLTLRT